MKYLEPIITFESARLLHFAGYSYSTNLYYEEFLKDVSYDYGAVKYKKGDVVFHSSGVNLENEFLNDKELAEADSLIYEACSLTQATMFLQSKNIYVEIMIDKTLEPKCLFEVSLFDDESTDGEFWKSYQSYLYKIENYYQCWRDAIYFGLSTLDIKIPIEYTKKDPVTVFSVTK